MWPNHRNGGSFSACRRKDLREESSRAMRFHLIMTICVGLTACTAEVPNSTTSGRQGVGFDNYNDYLAQQRARDAALARGGAPTNILPRPETTAQAATGATQTDAEQTANAALAAIASNQHVPMPVRLWSTRRIRLWRAATVCRATPTTRISRMSRISQLSRTGSPSNRTRSAAHSKARNIE